MLGLPQFIPRGRAMTLRLRCIRCGDLADLDPTDIDPGACARCRSKFWGFAHIHEPYPRRAALWFRHIKSRHTHPTYRALSAALEALESVPPGTLDTGSISLGVPDAEDDVLAFVDTSACEPADSPS